MAAHSAKRRLLAITMALLLAGVALLVVATQPFSRVPRTTLPTPPAAYLRANGVK